MAILLKPRLIAQERLDLEDMNVLISGLTADWQYWSQQFLANSAYILKGFTVSGLGGPSPATINLTNATLLNANNTAGQFSWYVAPTGASPLSAALVAGSRNYLELQLSYVTGSTLTRAFWDPSAQGGAGAEFNQTIDTTNNLTLSVNVLSGGFSGSANTIPLAIVDTDSGNNIKGILDKRPLFFRLGQPGSPLAGYSWASQTEPQLNLNVTGVGGTFVAGEIITFSSGATAKCAAGGAGPTLGIILPSSDAISAGATLTGGTSGATATLSSFTDSFTGADKSIGDFRTALSALMNEIKAIKGTQFWYSPTAGAGSGSILGALNFLNMAITPVSSGAKWSWNGTALSITDTSGTPAAADVIAAIRNFSNGANIQLQRADGQATTATIPIGADQVLFVQLPTSGTGVNYSGNGSGAANYQVVSRSAFVVNDQNFWIAYREGSTLVIRGGIELVSGESENIGDTVPQTLLSQLGVGEVGTPAYSSSIRGTSGESLVSRLGVLTDAMGDEQEDRSAYFRSDSPVTWTGSQIQFTSNIVLEILNTKSGTLTQHTILVAGSPISLNNGDIAWVLINRTAASENVTVNINAVPAQTQANKDVIVLARRVDALGAGYLHIPLHKQVLNPGQTVRLGASGSGSGSGSGTGDDLDALQYRISFFDKFPEGPTISTSSVDSSAGKTNATYSAAKALYQLSYDASKTVGGTGVNMTLSAAPSFTVAPGDVLKVGANVRRIATVTSQTIYVLEAAFPTDPTAGTACTVSQAVYTKDLNNFAVDGLAPSAAITSTFSEIMLDYEDSSAVGNGLFDVNTVPVIGASASADGTNYSAAAVRATNETDQIPAILLPTAGSNLYVRFFANKSSGSGTVNLIKYRAFWQKNPVAAAGGIFNQAYGFTNNVGTAVNISSISVVGGKSTITLNFPYAVGVNSGMPYGSLDVYLNGQLIPRFINSTLTPDASYTETTATVITLDKDYSAQNLSIEILQRTQIIDNSTTNTTSISALQEVQGQGFQGFINTSNLLLSTSTAGTPNAGTFYSTIQNRAPIIDLSQNLKAQMGIERIPAQQSFLLQTEFGPNGETVYGLLNDQAGMVRYVGAWINSTDQNGARVYTQTVGSYVEITFYGTGLNIGRPYNASTNTIGISVDGGAETVTSAIAESNILDGRNYTPNQIQNIVAGLPLGVHTVKIRMSAGSWLIPTCFEILNESSSVKVNPGTSYFQGKKYVTAAQQAFAYNAPVTGTVGGRVLVYQKSDGTIGQAFQPVNAASATWNSSDHTNEEILRSFSPREFGAGRGAGDDFSLGSGAAARAFTLDDGTTTLVATSAQFGSSVANTEAVVLGADNSALTLIFVGTGIDVFWSAGSVAANGNANAYTVSVDGGTPINFPTTGPAYSFVQQKIASGLPYGTHVVKFSRNVANNWAISFSKFITYQPKKPALPANAVIELADYNVQANYVADSTAITETGSSGVLFKQMQREMIFTGTWTGPTLSAVVSGGPPGGWFASATSAASAQYTFFGTGIEIISSGAASSSTTVRIDGSAPASATALGGGSYSAGTWTLGTTNGNKLSISGLTLGVHTVLVSWAAGTWYFHGMAVITPIHSAKSNLYAELQNTLPVGSCAISDNRKTSPIKDSLPAQKAWSQAVGVTSGPSTTSTALIPMPDLSLTIKTNGGPLHLQMSSVINNGANTTVAFYVDGIQVPGSLLIGGTTSYVSLSTTAIVPVAAGVHKVDVYWSTSAGTLTAPSTQRILVAREL